jgi:hypothetical protein
MMDEQLAFANAISRLAPGSEFSLKELEITWNSPHIEQPSLEAIQAESVRVLAEYEAKEYQRKRQPEYPAFTDFMDAMYWSSKGDNTKLEEYYAACEAVKAKYPKPTGGAE